VTVAFKNLLPLNSSFNFGKKPEISGSQIWAVRVLTDLGDAMFAKNACTRAVEWAGALMQIR
jgi:hypothetical protein